MLGRALDKISAVAKCRLKEHPVLNTELKDTISKIRSIQEKRNKIVHGYWLIDPEGRTPTKVRTYKLRWKDGCWQHLEETTFTATKLKTLIKESQKCVQTIQTIKDKIRTSLKKSKLVGLCNN